MNRTAIVIKLAPVAPPCFQTRWGWLEYLASCAAEQRPEHASNRQPLVFHRDKPPTFNRAFTPCSDCTASHAEEMKALRRCNPHHVEQLLPLQPGEAQAALQGVQATAVVDRIAA